MASAFVTATVINNHKWADNLFSLTLAVELAPFKAGQFIRLQLMIDGEKIAKPYSLVNPQSSKCAEVLYNTVKDGVMSNALAKLRQGDTIEISQPAVGFFVLEEIPDSEFLWMMGTGTGLGPYLSMLQEPTVWQRFEHIILVHAVSYASNLAYLNKIKALQNQHQKQLCYIAITSRESTQATLQGRIPELLNNGKLENKARAKISPSNTQIMLCGNQHMIADTRFTLSQRGLKKHLRRKPGHITTEQYF